MDVARRLGDIEIVSVDSMQVYREMDIGTSKPSPADRAEVPHHLLDVVDPGDDFSVAQFRDMVSEVIAAVEGRGSRALLVGGTGLYVQAIVDDLAIPGRFPDVRAAIDAEPDTAALHSRLTTLDPVAAARIEVANRRRLVRALEVTIGSGRPFSSFGPGLEAYPPAPFLQAGIWLPRPVLASRIEHRFDEMLAAGLLDEAARLASRSRGISRTARQALGYAELLAHLDGRMALAEARDVAIRRTRRFARRQRVWFRRDRRIVWHGADSNPLAVVPAILGDWSARCPR